MSQYSNFTSLFVTIFFYKGLTRNPEIRNTPVWVLLNIWRLGQIKDTKFDTNISNKTLLNAAKCQGYSFSRFWVIKGKPRGGQITTITQVKVKLTATLSLLLSYKPYKGVKFF